MKSRLIYIKLFNWISLLIYLFAIIGIVSIIFQNTPDQVGRFQYRAISPSGFVRTIVDYLELISLVIIISSLIKDFKIKKDIVLISMMIYSIFILIDINSWAFLSEANKIYYIIIAVQGLPLVLILYQLHWLKKNYKITLITGLVLLIASFGCHHYFYVNAIKEDYSSLFYNNYPLTITFTIWFFLTGCLLSLVSIMEWIKAKLNFLN